MLAATDESIRMKLDACEFAFQVGQMVESLLIDRGVKAARDVNENLVTLQMIRSSVDGGLFDELRKQLDEPVGQESRDAA